MNFNLPTWVIQSYGPIIIMGIGWLIRETRRGILEYHESQAEQNKSLAEIKVELTGLNDFRNESRGQLRSAWGKIDHHDLVLQGHGERISRIEGQQGPVERSAT